jgi:NAD(P)-dependent dehydrogenase (short-subunit alcohol dehydrogenase family)
MHLQGKVALVTGSSRGIGREIARELASRGARVAVHYRADREAARETLASLAGGAHAVFGADVADADAARDLVQNVVDEMGGIDILVNNAAIFEAATWDDLDFDLWQRVMAVNLNGPMLMPKASCRSYADTAGAGSSTSPRRWSRPQPRLRRLPVIEAEQTSIIEWVNVGSRKFIAREAAAVYGASEGLRTALLEREAFGGQAGTSSRIRNCLGFPDGVSGGELAQRAYEPRFSSARSPWRRACPTT